MVERTIRTHWNMHACSFVVSFGYPMAHFVVSGGYAGEIPPVVAYRLIPCPKTVEKAVRQTLRFVDG